MDDCCVLSQNVSVQAKAFMFAFHVRSKEFFLLTDTKHGKKSYRKKVKAKLSRNQGDKASSPNIENSLSALAVKLRPSYIPLPSLISNDVSGRHLDFNMTGGWTFMRRFMETSWFLKLNFRKYPAIHTNYITPQSTTL